MPDHQPNEKRVKIKRAIADIAPQIAHALGGRLAGAAVSALSRALFGDEFADDETIEKALRRLDGEQIVALKRAENEFAVALADARSEQERIAAGDRANARLRQEKMRDWAPTALGTLIILGFFIVLAAMVSQKLPDNAETEFSIMLGALATMTAAVVNYFFGSSAGSKEKTRLIAAPHLRTTDSDA